MCSQEILIEIKTVEDQLRVAMETSDVTTLGKLISDNLIFTNHIGNILSKDDDLRMHKNGDLNIESIVLSESIYKEINELVFISVRSDIISSYLGNPANGSFRFTRVWEKLDGNWQVIVGHSSIIV